MPRKATCTDRHARDESDVAAFHGIDRVTENADNCLHDAIRIDGRDAKLDSVQRAIEHGIRIRTVETQYDSIGVDTPEDLERVRQMIATSAVHSR